MIRIHGDIYGVEYTGNKSKEETMSEKFWMLYIEGRSSPTFKHGTIGDAHVEADRLARLPDNRGRKVYILEATRYCVIEEVPVSWHNVG